jgi:hypothetical protein
VAATLIEQIIQIDGHMSTMKVAKTDMYDASAQISAIVGRLGNGRIKVSQGG